MAMIPPKNIASALKPATLPNRLAFDGRITLLPERMRQANSFLALRAVSTNVPVAVSKIRRQGAEWQRFPRGGHGMRAGANVCARASRAAPAARLSAALTQHSRPPHIRPTSGRHHADHAIRFP